MLVFRKISNDSLHVSWMEPTWVFSVEFLRNVDSPTAVTDSVSHMQLRLPLFKVSRIYTSLKIISWYIFQGTFGKAHVLEVSEDSQKNPSLLEFFKHFELSYLSPRSMKTDSTAYISCECFENFLNCIFKF